MFFNFRERKKKGASTLEYSMMIIAIIACMLVMQKYIFRSMGGRWKNIGDTFGFGRQYDAAKTTECIYDMTVDAWIGLSCLDSCIAACDTSFGVGTNKICERACPGSCIPACPPEFEK